MPCCGFPSARCVGVHPPSSRPALSAWTLAESSWCSEQTACSFRQLQCPQLDGPSGSLGSWRCQAPRLLSAPSRCSWSIASSCSQRVVPRHTPDPDDKVAPPSGASQGTARLAGEGRREGDPDEQVPRHLGRCRGQQMLPPPSLWPVRACGKLAPPPPTEAPGRSGQTARRTARAPGQLVRPLRRRPPSSVCSGQRPGGADAAAFVNPRPRPAQRRSHLRAECGPRPTAAAAPDTARPAARPAS